MTDAERLLAGYFSADAITVQIREGQFRRLLQTGEIYIIRQLTDIKGASTWRRGRGVIVRNANLGAAGAIITGHQHRNGNGRGYLKIKLKGL